jgi:hypothetical protein
MMFSSGAVARTEVVGLYSAAADEPPPIFLGPLRMMTKSNASGRWYSQEYSTGSSLAV